MVLPLNVLVWQTEFCWHSDRDDLKATSDVIYQTEFYREIIFQRHTGAATLIFFPAFQCLRKFDNRPAKIIVY